jgi:hypothetical protein
MHKDGVQLDKPGIPGGEVLSGIAEIAAFLRVNGRTITGLISSGGLPVTRLGLSKVTTKTAVVNWLTKRAEGRIDG